MFYNSAWQSHSRSTLLIVKPVLDMPFLTSRTEPMLTIVGTATKMDMPWKLIPYGFSTGSGIQKTIPQAPSHDVINLILFYSVSISSSTAGIFSLFFLLSSIGLHLPFHFFCMPAYVLWIWKAFSSFKCLFHLIVTLSSWNLQAFGRRNLETNHLPSPLKIDSQVL